MRRRYNAAMALSALTALRAALPSVQFTTDLMVGFPGESDADFEETLAFYSNGVYRSGNSHP